MGVGVGGCTVAAGGLYRRSDPRRKRKRGRCWTGPKIVAGRTHRAAPCSQSYVRHAIREYNIHRGLRHANIVALLDIFEVCGVRAAARCVRGEEGGAKRA